MPTLVINPIGGLANRMRAIAGGISLARTLNLEYSIIWNQNWELNAKFEDVFEAHPLITSKIKYPSSLVYNLRYSVPRKKNLYLSKFALKTYGATLIDDKEPLNSIIRESISDPFVEDIISKSIKAGHSCFIQSGVNFYSFDPQFYRELFRPCQQIASRVAKTIANLGKDPVGIHIRRTDNVLSIRHSPNELFFDEIEKIIGKDTNTKFYLATDDESTKVIFKNRYPTSVITSNNKTNRNTRQGIIDAVTEMFTLASTTRIIGSHYSSFSEAASLLGNAPLMQLYRL